MKTFLTDLYEIDPTLKNHEAEIIPLVEKLLASDPAQAPDTEFVKRLRMQLQNRAVELSAPRSSVWQKIMYGVGGAVTAAVVLPLVFFSLNPNMAPSALQENGSPIFAFNIKSAGSQAFGPLSGMNTTTSADGAARTMGMGGGGGNAVSSPPVAESSTSDMAVGNAKMIWPYPMTQYEYVYEGTLADLSPTVAVFKRDPSGKNVSLASLASALNVGTIDLSSFAGMNVTSVTMSQNKPFGYMLTVNLNDSSIYLDAQWDQWPQSKCQTEACFQAQRVKLSDIPSDDVLTGIAQNFVKDHGIDLTGYDSPEVDNAWKRDYDRAETPDQAWIPDSIRVIYPLLIEGKPVLDQSGVKTGVFVSVHVQERKVMSVYGLMDRTYMKSDYKGVTDEQVIKDYISTIDNYGGIMPMMMETAPGATVDGNAPTPDDVSTSRIMPVPPDDGVKPDVLVSTIILGDPTVAYVQYYRYMTGVNEEILVPSLVFPIKEVKGMDSASYWRQSVIVPLSEEMLKEQNQVPPYRIMEGDVRAM